MDSSIYRNLPNAHLYANCCYWEEGELGEPVFASYHKKSFEVLKQRAENGSSSANYWLSRTYIDSHFYGENHEKSFECVCKAAKEGFPNAKVALFDFYVSGKAGKKDIPKAIELISEFSHLPYQFLKVFRARALVASTNDKEVEEGIRIFQDASSNGKWYEDATEALAIFYRDGGFLQKWKDPELYAKWSTAYHGLISKNATIRTLVDTLNSKDEGRAQDAFSKLKELSKEGYGEATLALGTFLTEGNKSIPGDMDAAEEYLRSPLICNDDESLARLGAIMLKRGQHSEGIKLIEAAASAPVHNNFARNYLIALYSGDKPEIGIPANWKKAIHWINLSIELADQIGINWDNVEGRQAYYAASFYFRGGNGLKPSIPEALRMLSISDAFGYDLAKERIKEINSSGVSFAQSPDHEPRQPDSRTPMEMLDELTGLEGVKRQIREWKRVLEFNVSRAARGFKAPAQSNSMLFLGNPGTGKTTVAKIVAGIMADLGIIEKREPVMATRDTLVAKYLGQTAQQTREVMESASGGILFIDEAYSLVQGEKDSYGRECIDTIVGQMEEMRDRLVIIAAGYTKNMEDFIDANPGLDSRFRHKIDFEDYSGEEMSEIFLSMAESSNLPVSTSVVDILPDYFDKQREALGSRFANARSVRNVFEKAYSSVAMRVGADFDMMSAIEVNDLPKS